MKKTILSLAIALASGTAMAGGLNTNTNSNAAYLRFFSQEANVSLTSLYANPAGSAFLSKGFHFGISNQMAVQERNVTTTFPLFQYNPNNNGSDTRRYEGKAFAPVIPSIDFVYNSGKKWSVSGHLGLVGGGGACEYKQGIGSFEAMYANKFFANGPVAAAGVGSLIKGLSAGSYPGGVDPMYQYAGYNVDAYMKGSTFMYGLQIGGTYKILDNLSVYLGVRGIYAEANYNGYVQDARMYLQSTLTDPTQKYVRDATLQAMGKQPGDMYVYNPEADLTMNCDQSGFGVTPIIGFHWEVNKHWNIAAKYEFKTRIRMENETHMNMYTQSLVAGTPETNPNYTQTLATFADGNRVPDDIPGFLAVGVQYSPKENLRLALSYHWMQDASANKGVTQALDPVYKTPMSDPITGAPVLVDKRNLINHDTHEVLAGLEWKCSKRVTLSGSWQKTMYGVDDDYMNDVSFNLSSNSMGIGMRIHASRLFNIDLGYMHTFYEDRTVKTYAGQKTDTYERKNDVVGIGINFAW